MSLVLSILLILLVVAIMFIAIQRYNNGIIDDSEVTDETVTTTTTTTTTTAFDEPVTVDPYVGTITRGWEDNKPYLFDPVDNEKMFLNETDDQYEDAAGKMWRLI